MPYSPLDDEMKQKLLEVVASELLTPKGCGPWHPRIPHIKAFMKEIRMQGIRLHIREPHIPGCLGIMQKAYLRLYKKSGVDNIKSFFMVLRRICRCMA
jgi:hypothetical protein